MPSCAKARSTRTIARSNDRDDMVADAMSTFVSLTVHCARCHDHKFDPIRQQDYYALQAVFAGVDRADRPYEPDAEHRASGSSPAERRSGDRAAICAKTARAAADIAPDCGRELEWLRCR